MEDGSRAMPERAIPSYPTPASRDASTGAGKLTVSVTRRLAQERSHQSRIVHQKTGDQVIGDLS